MISSDPDSLSVCVMIDKCDAPSVYQTMRRFEFRDSVAGRSTSQIKLESVKDAIVKPLRVVGLNRELVPFSLVGEMRAAIVSLKDKGIHLMKYPRMRKVKSGLSDRLVSLSIRGFRGQRLEYFELLNRLRLKVVMVQENLVTREDWAVTAPGYEFFLYCAREGSNHGVLLGISKGYVAQRITVIEDWFFYLLCNSTTERASAKGKHLELLLTWSLYNLEEPCIISGDFNISNSALGLLLKRHNTGYSVVDFSGSSKSFFGNSDKTWYSNDHIIDNKAAEGLVRNARVNRGYNISDHWTSLGSLLSSRKRADDIAATFVETSKKIAVYLTLYKASNRRPKRFYLTPSILKEIRAKDIAAAEWHKATESKNPSKKVKKLYLAFSKKRKEVKELIRTFNRNRWAKFLDKGAKIVASQNGIEHLKWLRRLLSESLYTKHKLSAVRDETGNLLTSPDKVMQRWSEFYTALSSDSTGNSRNPDRWIEVLGNKKDNPLDINHDISWDEVRMVLMSLALHKAPGGDGLEVGWYKVLFNGYDVYCPESPMAKAPLNLLQTIWRNGKIPKIWNITEIIPIPKKGDLQLLDNYRGISLIPVGMKILGRIIIGRITRQLEARKKIFPLKLALE
ncbi:LINE-1 retrotransposable element ORF2 protein [Smittium culicis]|uniref:LINE-1 retrotransposable element ORF2 protein n=1 Tax=Smittium culicis TaxID=133412 RepID=A0A1R1XBW6_9FUNG|nr:LINE-1 retrotransposable element ORF2 protein [Smittium culicis]